MTRTTLKALWVGGGGVLATWIAVSPNQGAAPASPPLAAPQSAIATSPPNSVSLNAQADGLRERTAAVTLRASTRNPFEFSSPRSRERVRTQPDPDAQPAAMTAAAPVAPPRPVFTLSGVAQTAGKRTAIITSDGQLYLVSEGDTLAGRYTVVTIEPEAVLIRDASGAAQSLVLPR